MLDAKRCPIGGGLGLLAPDFLDDPQMALTQLRDSGPVHYLPELGMWAVTRQQDVEEVFKDHKRFSGAVTQVPIFPLSAESEKIMALGFGASPTLSNCEPPKHTRVRSHMVKSFSARRIAVLESMVRARTEALTDRMLENDRFDVVENLTYPLPASVIFGLIGFPEEDTDWLKGLAAKRLAFVWGRSEPAEQIAVAENMVTYWKYCEEFVAQAATDPGDDLTGDLLRIHHGDPDALTTDEIVNVIHAVSFAGHETTTNVATSGLWRLLTHRELWDALRADPTLVPAAVEEALRFDPSLFTWRRVATCDTEIGGVPIPTGARLLLLVGSANHDERVFAQPEQFDLRRANVRQHLTFGRGIHFRFGAPLARLEIGAIFEHLSQRVPSLRLVPNSTVTFPENICFRGPDALWLELDR